MNERDRELAIQRQLITSSTKGIYVDTLNEFADLIRADEREACAKIARKVANATRPDDFALDKCFEIENAIRARGNT
jgi:hypothetical protein